MKLWYMFLIGLGMWWLPSQQAQRQEPVAEQERTDA